LPTLRRRLRFLPREKKNYLRYQITNPKLLDYKRYCIRRPIDWLIDGQSLSKLDRTKPENAASSVTIIGFGTFRPQKMEHLAILNFRKVIKLTFLSQRVYYIFGVKRI
jgi:hypothetical protein